ncbi:hypothetical protein PTKIN_Ptkin16aG0001800 [Pterospermum kingtungense]
MAGEGAMFKFLRPRLRPQPADIQAAALWGVAATTTALWLIQVSFFLSFLLLDTLCYSIYY